MAPLFAHCSVDGVMLFSTPAGLLPAGLTVAQWDAAVARMRAQGFHVFAYRRGGATWWNV
jgi:hypothetical protein